MAAGEAEACRTCLGARALGPLFPEPARYRGVQLALRLCTGLQMDFNDGLPQYICRICNQTVEAMMLFRFQSQIANKNLLNLCKSKITSTSKNTSEVKSLLKWEHLPTTIELKLYAKNKLTEFYNHKKKIPEILYSPTEDRGEAVSNMIIEKAQLLSLPEIIAEQKKLLAENKFKRSNTYLIGATATRTHNTDSKAVEKNNLHEATAESVADTNVKLFTDFVLDCKPLVKCKVETEMSTLKHKKQIKLDVMDSEDDLSDRDVDNLQTLADVSKCSDGRAKKRKVSMENITQVKPQKELVPVPIEVSKVPSMKRKKRPLRPKANMTSSSQRLQGTKASRSCKKSLNTAKKRRKGTAEKKITQTERTPVKKIYIIREDKRRDFRQKCWDLIKGPFDHKSRNIQCNVCENTYKDIYTFERHAQRHLGYRHVCEFCRRGFESRDVMLRHIEQKHPKRADIKTTQITKDDKRKEFREKCLELIEGPFDSKSTQLQCKLCHVVCKNIRYFETHAQKHLGYNHLCEVCARGFPSQFALTRHHERTHTQQAEEKRQKSERGQWREFRQKCYQLIEGPYHSKSKNVQCKVCRAFFSGLQAFATHAQIHLGYKHFCEYCTRGFPSKAHLKQHLQASHGLARELACSYCDYKAIYQKQLQIHTMRFHTKERPFICDECGSGYFSRPVLMQHIRQSHQKEKPFQCDKCPHIFKQLGVFNESISIYARTCDKCPRKFKQLNQLNYHKKLKHNPTFTFLCHICANTFMTTENVRKHYLKIHKIPREQQVEKVHRLYFDKMETKPEDAAPLGAQ